MQRIIKPIRRIYSEDAAYRNFVLKDYQRKLQLHHDATASEIKQEAKINPHINFYTTILHHPRLALFAALLAMVITIFYTRALLTTIAFGILLVVASYSTIYKRKLGIPLGGIELITFGTVITGVAFGPAIGLLFGIASSLASELISQNIGPLTWLYVLTTGLVGLLAGSFGEVNLVVLGMAATVFTLIINQTIFLFVGDGELKSMVAFYIAANIIFNIIMFTTLSARTLTLLIY